MDPTAHLNEAIIRQYRDHALSAENLLEADRHLAHCESCRGRVMPPDALSTAYALFVDPDQEVVGYGEAPPRLAGGEDRSRPHLEPEVLAAYVDGALDEPERTAVEGHLTGCPACAADARDLEAFSS